MKEAIKLDRQTYLINKAEELFFAKGYYNTSVSDIGKAADCSRTTLYKYFESKENLYIAVAQRSFEFFIKEVIKINQTTENGFERLMSICTNYLNFWENHPQHFQVIADFLSFIKDVTVLNVESPVGQAMKSSSYFGEVKELINFPFKYVIKEIERGQQDQSVLNKTQSEQLFINLWSILVGFTNVLKHSNHEDSLIFLGLSIKGWKENALGMIRSLLSQEVK